ncbi:L-histidine N(alpha)-methyltransferase [Belliella sp. R4-6]|uniref:L-histidine N(Alpha)-methyltransferase n=1 Tax=Belliella alkalica TaxID=1730871 RepID=A0ABS9VD43_9BACT|nr:L-histidine N(alpha)-methyltransferase [Belliella alkalica]MCH7413798.1 L-histidine N(alpha)-methyltransferase [Belliella alkalica]
MDRFLRDVIDGLSSEQKTIPSMYFYDESGSKIFQEIMGLEEYYLPACEVEILNNSAESILEQIPFDSIDIIELGAGDGSKMISFLELFHKKIESVTYIPMDISPEILEVNKSTILRQIPDIKIITISGDYTLTTGQLVERENPRLILFMGSNIGNYSGEKAKEFMRFVNDMMKVGDYFLMGVDLKKNPHIIRKAYNDSKGVTKRFNLNLLERINRELKGDFDIDSFGHYGTYNPINGEALSFLFSENNQQVTIGNHVFKFEKYETIRTEISRKYSLKELDSIGKETGFEWDKHFLDSKEYFSLSLFRK